MKILLTTLLFATVSVFSYCQIGFTEMSSSYGIEHTYAGYWGGGVSFCDFNGDGLDDLSYCTEQGETLQFYVMERFFYFVPWILLMILF